MSPHLFVGLVTHDPAKLQLRPNLDAIALQILKNLEPAETSGKFRGEICSVCPQMLLWSGLFRFPTRPLQVSFFLYSRQQLGARITNFVTEVYKYGWSREISGKFWQWSFSFNITRR